MIEETSHTDSFAAQLAAVAPGVPSSLVSADRLADIAGVARMLPGILAFNTFGFECRLSDAQARADLLVQATAAYGRDVLAGTGPAALPGVLRADPVWRRVRALAGQWQDRSAGLGDCVDNLWLEFDVDGPLPGVPIPSVFLGLRVVDRDASETVTVVRTMAGTLDRGRSAGGGLSAGAVARLTCCLRALQAGEYLLHVGMMTARGLGAVRLCVRLRSMERTAEFLREIGWADDGGASRAYRDLAAALDLARGVDYIWLDLDVGETVRPSLGLELYVHGHAQPRQDPRWATLLDEFVKRGLCTPAKRDGLLAYPGHSREGGPGVRWPETLRRSSRLMDGRAVSTFVRRLHHIKVVCSPGRRLEAKAYLAAVHHWHTPGVSS